MHTPTFSIITVTKNNANGLAKSLASVKGQVCRDFELIIIDGHSTDATEQVISEYADIVTCALHDEANGIYAAMNQGIDVAYGDWLIFMNAGDYFYDDNVLLNFNVEDSVSIVYGRARREDDTLHLAYDESDPFWSRMPISHQAIFFHKRIMSKRKYDTSFSIVGDFEYLMWAKKMELSFHYIDLNIARIEFGGISGIQLVKRVWQSYRAAIRYYPQFKVHLFYLRKLLWAFMQERIKKQQTKGKA